MMTTSRAARTRKISAAEAKAKLSELLSRVSLTKERYVIERRGKAVAALVSVGDLERLDAKSAQDDGTPEGLLALRGLWADILTDDEITEFVHHIYAERIRDKGRPPPTFD